MKARVSKDLLMILKIFFEFEIFGGFSSAQLVDKGCFFFFFSGCQKRKLFRSLFSVCMCLVFFSNFCAVVVVGNIR